MFRHIVSAAADFGVAINTRVNLPLPAGFHRSATDCSRTRAMTVSTGDLDSLLNLSFAAADFGGVTIDTWTSPPGQSAFPPAIDSLSVTATGSPAPGHSASEELKVVSVDDETDQVTFTVSGADYSYQSTDWVLGFGPESLLLSREPLTAVELDTGSSYGIRATAGAVTGVLSNSPLAEGAEITFPVHGTSSVTRVRCLNDFRYDNRQTGRCSTAGLCGSGRRAEQRVHQRHKR
jgi:hypothetical protein